MVKDQTVRQYLADALAEALFHQPGPIRLQHLLQALPEHCPAPPQLALEVLAEDHRFIQIATRWDLAHRVEAGLRPLGGALEIILQGYGRPILKALLISELCLCRSGSPVHFAELLDRFLLSSRDVGAVGRFIYLTRWLFNSSSHDEKGLLFINRLSEDEAFLALRPKLLAPSVKQRAVLDTAEAVLKLAKFPLSNPALGLVLYHHHRERFSTPDVLAEMCTDERFLCLNGPSWVLGTQEKTILRTLSKEAATQEPLETERVDMATVLQGDAGKLKLDEATVRAVAELVRVSRTPITVEEVLTDQLQLRPRQRNFAPAARTLDKLLSLNVSLLRSSPGRYVPWRNHPVWVESVPETLIPEMVSLAPKERSLDVLLPVEELAPGLLEHVANPFYEDQGDEHIRLIDESLHDTQIAIPIHHHQSGTMKLRLLDRRLFDVPGPVSIVRFRSPQGVQIPIWINLETRLLYGFLNWYDEFLPCCGALMRITRDAQEQDLYHLQYDGGTDQGTYIGKERLAQVMALRGRLRRRPAFVVNILELLLFGNTRGLAFDQLWSQTNILRRTTRLQVASVLTAYEQFAPTEGGRWRLQ